MGKHIVYQRRNRYVYVAFSSFWEWEKQCFSMCIKIMKELVEKSCRILVLTVEWFRRLRWDWGICILYPADSLTCGLRRTLWETLALEKKEGKYQGFQYSLKILVWIGADGKWRTDSKSVYFMHYQRKQPRK